MIPDQLKIKHGDDSIIYKYRASIHQQGQNTKEGHYYARTIKNHTLYIIDDQKIKNTNFINKQLDQPTLMLYEKTNSDKTEEV